MLCFCLIKNKIKKESSVESYENPIFSDNNTEGGWVGKNGQGACKFNIQGFCLLTLAAAVLTENCQIQIIHKTLLHLTLKFSVFHSYKLAQI